MHTYRSLSKPALVSVGSLAIPSQLKPTPGGTDTRLLLPLGASTNEPVAGLESLVSPLTATVTFGLYVAGSTSCTVCPLFKSFRLAPVDWRTP